MEEIHLTQQQVALVDADKFKFLSQWKWCASKQKQGFYAVRGTLRCEGPPRLISMHRVLLGIDGTSLQGDHVNGNKLDNRMSNLRVATDQENKRGYRVLRKGKLSSYRGVVWDKSRLKWMARYYVDGRFIFAGRYRDERDAAQAYNFGVYKAFGRFAVQNEAA